jgi:UDP-N-acetyl-D-mannosaminuronic acid dehydrogenase
VVVAQLEHSGLRIGTDVLVAHCPERVLPGNILDELVNGDRIVGGLNRESTQSAVEFYRTFVKGTLVETDLGTAEFCKLMENTYRDVNIALANQIAELAGRHGIDAHEAVRIANYHPRVDYLSPGIGVGGHCIPVDPWFLLTDDDAVGVIQAARAVNDRQPSRVADEISAAVGDIESPKLLLIGAAYKPNVEDSRNSPALEVRDELERRGVLVEVYDPLVEEFSHDLLGLATGADAAVILVPHQLVIDELATRSEDLARVMRRPILLDATGGMVQHVSFDGTVS